MEYYEREKEMLTKVDSVVVIARDAPLLTCFMDSAVLAEVRMNSVNTFSGQAGFQAGGGCWLGRLRFGLGERLMSHS